MNAYFVTGIGTGVGKTLSAAALTEALQADYWKPIQTGPDSDRNTVEKLISNPVSQFHPESYYFKEPASPHLAAALEQQEIATGTIRFPHSTNKNLIIEGAGGLLVPLNKNSFVIDLAKQLEAEVILVCRSYLGCINHSLLSIDYLMKNNFRIKGLVLNGDFDPLVRSAIVNYAALPVLAELEELPYLSRDSVRKLAGEVNLNLFV